MGHFGLRGHCATVDLESFGAQLDSLAAALDLVRCRRHLRERAGPEGLRAARNGYQMIDAKDEEIEVARQQLSKVFEENAVRGALSFTRL